MDSKNLNIAECWDIILQFEYDKEIILSGIESFLSRFREKKILDCACGTGFLSLDLIRKGYDITCSDGSELMLNQFRRNADKIGVKVEPYRYNWSELSEKFADTFDLVMCRGSSLIYVNAWDTAHTNTVNEIYLSLRNFYECLHPGGWLYVDTTSESNLKRDNPELIDYQKKIIDGYQIKLTDKVFTDHQRRIRIWEPTILIDKTEYRSVRYSSYLPHPELIGLLRDCGFTNIQKIDIDGEHYDVFIARKE